MTMPKLTLSRSIALALLTLTACGQGGPDRVFRFGADPAQDTQPAAAPATCADLAPATPTRPQPAERPRPEAPPHFDTPDGGTDGGGDGG
jgi:hypothetical protein